MDINKFDEISLLIDEQMKAKIEEVFKKLPKKIILKAIVEDNEQGKEMASFLRTIVNLSDCLSLEIYEPKEKVDIDRELGTELLPTVAIYDENHKFLRVVFRGLPGGKELNTFIMAICYGAGLGKELGARELKRINKIKKKTQIQVLVSLECHHCFQMAINCQQLAILNENIYCEIIDARLYPHLVEEYNIQQIPLTLINQYNRVKGVKTLEEICDNIS